MMVCWLMRSLNFACLAVASKVKTCIVQVGWYNYYALVLRGCTHWNFNLVFGVYFIVVPGARHAHKFRTSLAPFLLELPLSLNGKPPLARFILSKACLRAVAASSNSPIACRRNINKKQKTRRVFLLREDITGGNLAFERCAHPSLSEFSV